MMILDISFYDKILYPFNVVVSWILVGLHKGLVKLGMEPGPNFAWVLAIIGLTLVVRSAIIPLYAKQIKSQRAMQEIQPLLQEINEKYKGRTDQVSVQQKNQETFDLYREHGVKPLASCLPLLIQMPFIIALYRVLLNTGPIAAGTWGKPRLGAVTQQVASEIEATKFLGIPLSTTFKDARALGHTDWMIIIIVMAIVMASIMFSTMWLLSVKNLPKGASDQNAKMMKMMAFFGPAMTLMFSFVVQMGVLVYWLVTNLFTATQQMVILKKAPTKGSPAHDKFLEKAGKKYETYKAEEEAKITDLMNEYDLSESDISTAWGKIQRAEEKVGDGGADQFVIDPKQARFKSTSSLRKDLHQKKVAYLSADATRERLGDDDPYKDDERGENIHAVVAAKRILAANLKEKRIRLGMERDTVKKPTKKGFFARRMEEAMELQEQQQRQQQRGGQRYQPSKKTRAERQAAQKKRQADAKKKKPGGDLTPEEIERRRQERRRQARAQSKKKRKKK